MASSHKGTCTAVYNQSLLSCTCNFCTVFAWTLDQQVTHLRQSWHVHKRTVSSALLTQPHWLQSYAVGCFSSQFGTPNVSLKPFIGWLHFLAESVAELFGWA